MGDYESLINRLDEQFSFKETRINKEQVVINNILSILNEKIPWYKPWKVFSYLRKIKKATILLGTICTACLSDLIQLQENQINILQIQRAFQDQLDMFRNSND